MDELLYLSSSHAYSAGVGDCGEISTIAYILFAAADTAAVTLHECVHVSTWQPGRGIIPSAAHAFSFLWCGSLEISPIYLFTSALNACMCPPGSLGGGSFLLLLMRFLSFGVVP